MPLKPLPSRDDSPHAASRGDVDNLLLAALPEHERIASLAERVQLGMEENLYEAGATLTHYAFPMRGGVVSMVKEMQGGTVEVGTVGYEGVIGISALLGVRTIGTRVFAQSPSMFDLVRVEDLDAVMDSSPGTRHVLMRYVHAFHEEIAQSVACNRLHALEERCARWLLMSHDRTGSDTMRLKQRFLSYMLGVHRPAVSLAAGALQKAGLIRYRRGLITILDRAGLEDASCECYAFGRNAFARARLTVRTPARE
jgi:CRP-like cAMP-binding protein